VKVAGKSERLANILERIGASGAVAIDELAKEFNVSASTVRRDLQELAQQHLLTRTHGGAVGGALSYELPLRYRGGRRSEQKQRIAKAAAKLVPPGATVGISGGTTTTEAARLLATRDELTVVTNALNIAAELAVRPNIRLFVTGGLARPSSFELVGPSAENALMDYNLDIALLGVNGMDVEAGCTTHDYVEARTNAALIKRARRQIVLADSTKLGQVAFARICGIDEVDLLVTDNNADPSIIAAFRKMGLEVEVV
jgi:DeoR family transcriptional regulator of aga operon